MNDLRSKFLKAVTSSSNSHIVIADLDGLMEYAEFRAALIQNGYRVIDAENGLAGRIKFELEIRGTHEPAALVVPGCWDILPDIEQDVHFIELELDTLLPKLSPKIIKGLGFEALEQIAREKQYAELNEEQTLSHVFKALYVQDLTTLRNSTSKEYVLSAVIRVVLEICETNKSVRACLAELLRRYFPSNDFELDPKELLQFLQKEWERFLNNSGDLAFEDIELRKSMADLFLTGRLTPVKVDQSKFSSLSRPLSLGCYFDFREYEEERFASLLDRLDAGPCDGSTFDYWRQAISTMAMATLDSFESTNTNLLKRYSSTSESLNNCFQNFIESEYDKLFTLSGVKRPATVTRVLEHIKFHKATKKALLVLDGMTYWQWVMIADYLRSQDIECLTDVTTAYIPSITAWSRQAIFKGGMPDLIADNSKEEKLFRSYWTDNGFTDYEIGFEKLSFANHSELPFIPETKAVLGLVSNDLDEFMHAALGGNKKLQNDTAFWLENSSFVENIKKLKQLGFVVFITTDHGSVEATGIRNLKLIDKLGSVSRSKRHTYFSNETMLENFIHSNPTLDIGQKGLSIFLKNNEAFTSEGDLVVTHGGSHFWEVLIPFVQI